MIRGILFLVLIVPMFISSRAYALTAISSSMLLGSKGADVTTLQQFLAQDSTIYPEGLVTGYFGTLTQAAVRRFQARYGISQVGQVGPQTRAQINTLIASGGFGTGTSGGGTASGPTTAPYIFGAMVGTTTSNYITGTTTDSSGQTVTGRYAQNVTVSWQTDKAARGKVYYSSSPLSFSETSSSTQEPVVTGIAVSDDGSYTTSKSITLSGLNTNSSVVVPTYYYMIESIDANGNVSVTWPGAVSTLLSTQ